MKDNTTSQADEAKKLYEQGCEQCGNFQFAEAVETFTKAIELDPTVALYYSYRGDIYDELEDNQNALKDYNKAIQLDPSNAEYYSARGVTHKILKDIQTALKDFDKAVQLDSTNDEYYRLRGLCYVMKGYEEREREYYKNAVEDLEKAVELGSTWREIDDTIEDLRKLLSQNNNEGEKKKRTFVYQDEKSQKFWSIETQGTNFTVNFGKLGTNGQTSEKTFATEDECQKAADKLIAEKVKKGYKETADNTDVANSSAKLKFKSFNFKLIIINELMYKQEWLKPKFDVWEFAEKNGIDIEEKGYDPIPKVVKYFKNLEIDEKFANEVKEIELWGDYDIYNQIWPHWDGECDYFDVTKLTAEEVKQFPNLKITVAEGILTDESIEVLESCGAFADNARGMSTPHSANDTGENKKDEVSSKIKNVFENGFEIKQNGIIVSYNGDEKDLTIPPVIGGIKVLKIGGEKHEGVLANKGLTSVVISEGITHIGSEAFRENKLVKVVFPKSLKIIGSLAFMDNNLTEIVIPENIEDDISEGVFKGNPLKVITVSRGGMFLWIRPDFYKCYKENGMKAGTYILDGEKWKLKE